MQVLYMNIIKIARLVKQVFYDTCTRINLYHSFLIYKRYNEIDPQ